MSLVDLVRSTIVEHSYSIVTEMELHTALDELLTASFPAEDVLREVSLTDRHGVSVGRIDFVIGRVGIEVKVGGAPGAVARQLERYQRSPALTDVLLVTTRMLHCQKAPHGVVTAHVGGGL